MLLYHSFGYLNLSSHFHGEAGVDGFLLLSGFGLAYGARPEHWLGFAWRRLKRLLPAYWVALALCSIDLWSHGAPPAWRQIVVHAACLHLILGDDYAFAFSMSYWFIGLIVPLYFWFALLRPWILRGHGYAVLGLSAAVATAGGMVLLRWFPEWGASSLGHAPHRLPHFFLGALAGLAYSRRDTPDRFAREPVMLLGLAILAGVVIYFEWAGVPFFLLGGAGIIVLAVMLTAAGERWRVVRPLVLALTAIGGLAYELYLCHQYLMLSVLHRDLLPRLERWLPKDSPFHRSIIMAIAAFVLSLWIAWALRWLVALRDCRRDWPRTARTLVTLTVAGAIATGVLARPPRPPRTRTFELSIEPPTSPLPASIEPVIYFGAREQADLIFIEHDGTGRARFRIDHWGLPSLFSDWLPTSALVTSPVNVIISGEFLEVRSPATTLRSTVPPYAPRAYPVVGTNDLQLAGIEPAARSKVTRSPHVVRSK